MHIFFNKDGLLELVFPLLRISSLTIPLAVRWFCRSFEFMKIWGFNLFSISFVLLGSTAFALEPKKGIVDDHAMRGNFQRGLEALHAKKQATPLKSLLQQLGRRKTTLEVVDPKLKNLSSSNFYEACKSSVLLVGRLYKCGKCTKWHISSASGFAVGEDVIATNYHVVENTDGVVMGAMDFEGKTYAVKEVLAAHKADDVAILRVANAKLKPLALAAPAPVGTSVSVISHPDGRYFTMTKGDVSRYFVARPKTGRAERMAITADYAKGSSGAPVLDASGAVVGMVSATSSIYYNKSKGHNENLQMVVKSCVPVSAILRLLEFAD